MPSASALPTATAWTRRPELALLLLGIVLRLSMVQTYSVAWGYDFYSHWPYIDWFVRHPTELPPLGLCRETYHPPLYYFLTGLVHRLGVPQAGLGAVSAVCGCARLALFWLALELYLPGPGPRRRVARLSALALAAVMPPSIHLEGMVTGEGLSNLLAMAAMLAMPWAVRATGSVRWRRALLLGLLVGLQLLTKVSALSLVGAMGLTALCELWRRGEGGWRGRALRLAPWLGALLMLVLCTGWYFSRNQRLYGKAFLSGFDGLDSEITRREQVDRIPYLERRPPSYFLGWSNDILRFPYYPSAVTPNSYFFPTLIASSFVDYYNYRFAGPPTAARVVRANGGFVGHPTLWVSQASVLGGVVLALTTMLAWLAVFTGLWRRRTVVDLSYLPLLLLPLITLLGQLHFATKYAVDNQGPVKGLYMQFASPPLYALWGLAVAWLWEGRRTRPIAWLQLIALGLIAFYTLYCRIPWLPH